MSLSGIFDPLVRAYFNRTGGGSYGVAVSWNAFDEEKLQNPPLEKYEYEGGTWLRIANYLTADELDGSMLLGAIRDATTNTIIADVFEKFSISDETIQSTEIADGVVGYLLVGCYGEQIGMSIPKEVESLFGVRQGTYIAAQVFLVDGAFVTRGCKIA